MDSAAHLTLQCIHDLVLVTCIRADTGGLRAARQERLGGARKRVQWRAELRRPRRRQLPGKPI